MLSASFSNCYSAGHGPLVSNSWLWVEPAKNTSVAPQVPFLKMIRAQYLIYTLKGISIGMRYFVMFVTITNSLVIWITKLIKRLYTDHVYESPYMEDISIGGLISLGFSFVKKQKVTTFLVRWFRNQIKLFRKSGRSYIQRKWNHCKITFIKLLFLSKLFLHLSSV